MHIFCCQYHLNSGDEVAEDETNIWADIFRDYINPDEEPLEPVCDISYPIVDEIGPLDFKSSDYNPANHSVVGMVGASMYWREIIQNVLPPGSNGITVVFQNACTEPFTYQVNGPDVVYLGVGDKHHKSFDRLQIHRSIDELFGKSDSLYSGAQVDSSFCPMTVHFYPSKIMESEYKTQNPMIFTVSVMLIFAFALVVFYFYDAKVDSRQKTVMQTATHSSAIVSSLFPSEVRDRLYPIAEEKFDYKVLGNSSTRPSDSPIAHLYPDTTVLFADLVGFTSWSATREPCQVFHLLETVYAGFDKIAKQRGVFKIETIGDCYVAVVGLPKPRAHHAVVMARFASECCDIMQVVVSDLETTLGPVSVHRSWKNQT